MLLKLPEKLQCINFKQLQEHLKGLMKDLQVKINQGNQVGSPRAVFSTTPTLVAAAALPQPPPTQTTTPTTVVTTRLTKPVNLFN